MPMDEREELFALAQSLRRHLEMEHSRLSFRRGSETDLMVPEFTGTVEDAGEDSAKSTFTLEEIREELGDCKRCGLHETRRHLVFGEGNPRARLVFVGEAPGESEDRIGRPFVGRAGQLLTRIIEAMNLSRDDVYICNILKCRPPGNRNPRPDEIRVCEPFLIKQLQAICPAIICAMGTFAAKTLLQTENPISLLRGQFHLYHGIPLMPTYHPAYLLRNPGAKKLVWQDMKMIMDKL